MLKPKILIGLPASINSTPALRTLTSNTYITNTMIIIKKTSEIQTSTIRKIITIINKGLNGIKGTSKDTSQGMNHGKTTALTKTVTTKTEITQIIIVVEIVKDTITIKRKMLARRVEDQWKNSTKGILTRIEMATIDHTSQRGMSPPRRYNTDFIQYHL
jgi:hypothetical protein